MNKAWPKPKGGWVDIDAIGEPLTDGEIRALGWKPTRDGWKKRQKRNLAGERRSVRHPTSERGSAMNLASERPTVPVIRKPRPKRPPRTPRSH